MILKSINNVIGYKDLPDGFNAEFDENQTYIIGTNFQRKTTVGSLFNWCLTGTSLYGNEKEQVQNDKEEKANVIVDMTFLDNYGIEHRLIRDKGKRMNLILDGKEIKQEQLAEFYHDKNIFLVSHNPYYFATLEPKEQKELIRKIIPAISKENSFKLLAKDENFDKNINLEDILGEPIEHIEGYIDKKNDQINDLQKEYNENVGYLEAYKNMAYIQTGEILQFDKEKELNELQERFETMSINLENSNLEDLQHSITRINEKVEELVKEKLSIVVENYNKEKQKLKNASLEKYICSTCRQEIKDDEVKEHLKKFYMKELDKLQEKANKIKQETKDLLKEKQQKQEIFEKLNTSEMKELQEEKEKLKKQIDILQQEKREILLHNKEIEVKQEQLKKVQNNIEIAQKAIQEILIELETIKKQKEIANKLKRLVIEQQKQEINKYLDKVDIQFCRENKTNDKITECCDIYYEGREYKKLSKSQQVRACLEISNLFNNLSKIKAPIFLDDAESVTDINQITNTQMIISLVIKYNTLEILYDYSEVLDRKKKSIEREFAESNNYIIKQAA